MLRHLVTSWHLNTWKVKIWLSQDWKVLLKWNEKYISLLYKCSFTELKIRLTKNVVNTTFKLVLIGIWKNLWNRQFVDTCYKLSLLFVLWLLKISLRLFSYSYFLCKRLYDIMFIMQTQPQLVCVANICLPETLKYWVGVQQD